MFKRLRNIRINFRGDKVIWMVFILFLVISAIEVYSSLGKVVFDTNTSPNSMFAKHLRLLGLGTITFYIVQRIDFARYARFTYPLIIFSIALLVITLLIGTIGGKSAARWIAIPFLGQFQPSEVVKILLILHVARLMAVNRNNIESREVFKKVMIPIAAICLLILPENFSTAAILFLICYLLMYVGGLNRQYLRVLPLGLIAALFILFLINLASPSLIERSLTWSNRISSWYYNDLDAITQPNLARMAISTGGLSGKFLGNTEHARFLSESHNDFIFAIIVEEGGVFLAISIIALYMILLYRGIVIAKKSVKKGIDNSTLVLNSSIKNKEKYANKIMAKSLFGSYISAGLTLMIVVQALINMFVATGITPVTGQTLPFISYGGTSFLFSCIALGVVQNISEYTTKDLDISGFQFETMESDNNEIE